MTLHSAPLDPDTAAANVAAVRAREAHIDELIAQLQTLRGWVTRDRRDYLLGQLLKQWATIPPDDQRWNAAEIILGIQGFYRHTSAPVVAMRDAAVLLLVAADDVAADCGEDSTTGGAPSAMTVAKLRWSQQHLARAIAMIEADSFEAFAAARGVPSAGDGGPS